MAGAPEEEPCRLCGRSSGQMPEVPTARELQYLAYDENTTIQQPRSNDAEQVDQPKFQPKEYSDAMESQSNDDKVVERLENKVKELNNLLLKKEHDFRSLKQQIRDIIGDDEQCEKLFKETTAEDIKKRMLKYCKEVDIHLPRLLEIDKNRELWPVCNAIFEISFKHCRDSFIHNLTEPLYLLTELSEEEHKTSATDWDRKDELESVFTAYEYLIEYSKTSDKLRHVDESIVEKVITSVSNKSNSELVSQLHDLVKEVVELCWRMQMLPTPMFICQPELYNENWHDVHRKSWSGKTNELIYYRPVLMNSAGGSVACKGYVGNVSEKEPCCSNTLVTKEYMKEGYKYPDLSLHVFSPNLEGQSYNSDSSFDSPD